MMSPQKEFHKVFRKVCDPQPLGSARYLGQFVSGQRQGYGCMKYRNGDTYQGHFNLGLHGAVSKARAALRSRDRAAKQNFFAVSKSFYLGVEHFDLFMTASGEWLAGQKHGEGSYHFFGDGSELSGSWVEGFLKRGRWVLPTGATYVGEFLLNKPTGKGSWMLPQGRQVLVEYTQEKRGETLDGENGKPTTGEDEANVQYQVDPAKMRCICCVKTRH